MAKNAKKEIKGTRFPKMIWVTRKGDGSVAFWENDPLGLDGEPREINLGDEVLGVFSQGAADALNPVMIHIAGAVNERGRRFDAGTPERIRTGQEDAHVRDLEGSVVEIIRAKNPEPGFPFTGVVISSDGTVAGHRAYSGTGSCADGVAAHSLVVINGQPEFKQNTDTTEAGD